MTVTVTDKGPRVVSPPTRGKPVCSLASFRPSTKAVNQPSSTQGIVSANSIPCGCCTHRRQVACRGHHTSEGDICGGHAGQKMDAFNNSVDRSMKNVALGTLSTAASSPTPSLTAAPASIPEKNRLYYPNSPTAISRVARARPGVTPAQPCRARR